MKDLEDEDAVSFKMRNTFQFRPDLGLSGQELITMPHPLLQVSSVPDFKTPHYNRLPVHDFSESGTAQRNPNRSCPGTRAAAETAERFHYNQLHEAFFRWLRCQLRTGASGSAGHLPAVPSGRCARRSSSKCNALQVFANGRGK